jgi:hypothetical protein
MQEDDWAKKGGTYSGYPLGRRFQNQFSIAADRLVHNLDKIKVQAAAKRRSNPSLDASAENYCRIEG